MLHEPRILRPIDPAANQDSRIGGIDDDHLALACERWITTSGIPGIPCP